MPCIFVKVRTQRAIYFAVLTLLMNNSTKKGNECIKRRIETKMLLSSTQYKRNMILGFSAACNRSPYRIFLRLSQSFYSHKPNHHPRFPKITHWSE